MTFSYLSTTNQWTFVDDSLSLKDKYLNMEIAFDKYHANIQRLQNFGQ